MSIQEKMYVFAPPKRPLDETWIADKEQHASRSTGMAAASVQCPLPLKIAKVGKREPDVHAGAMGKRRQVALEHLRGPIINKNKNNKMCADMIRSILGEQHRLYDDLVEILRLGLLRGFNHGALFPPMEMTPKEIALTCSL
jgi:hypothetical protein